MNRIVSGLSVLAEWAGSGLELVPTEQAQARLRVCTDTEWTDASGRKHKGCPHNSVSEAWHLLTKPVAQATLKLLGLRRKMNLALSGDKRAGTCKICLCSLRLKVFVPTETIAEETDEELLKEMPVYCWQRVEILKHRENNPTH